MADAVMRGDTAAVRALLAQKADVTGRRAMARRPFIGLCSRGPATTNLLIQAGANVKAPNHEGATPLARMPGRQRGHHRDPLESGRGSERETSERRDGFMMASRTGSGGDEGVVDACGREREGKVARDDGADVGRRSGHAAAIKLLLEHGADIQARSNSRRARKAPGQIGRST